MDLVTSDICNDDSFSESTAEATERRALVESIIRLGSHVSESVVKELVEKVKQLEQEQESNSDQPNDQSTSISQKSQTLLLASHITDALDSLGEDGSASSSDEMIDYTSSNHHNERSNYYVNELFDSDRDSDFDSFSIVSETRELCRSCDESCSDSDGIVASASKSIDSSQESGSSSFSDSDSFDSFVSSSDNSYDDFLDYCIPMSSTGGDESTCSQSIRSVAVSMTSVEEESKREEQPFDSMSRSTHSVASGISKESSFSNLSQSSNVILQTSIGSKRRDTSLINTDKVMKLRQNRLNKKNHNSHSINDNKSELAMIASPGTFDEQLRSKRQQSAMLFVDISGFTALSALLPIEEFSKAINNYFQIIVDEIESFAGDILKFAGDALIVEWQVTSLECGQLKKRRRPKRRSETERGIAQELDGCLEDIVLIAALCACSLVDRCSDFCVLSNEIEEVNKLNLHCGIGFGDAVGVHVGNHNRMEHLILGDSIRQCSEAANFAKDGEVAASPEVLTILAKFVTSTLSSRSVIDFDLATDEPSSCPQIIASRSTRFFEVQQQYNSRMADIAANSNLNFTERIANQCNNLNINSLEILQSHIMTFVHPVVFLDHSASNSACTSLRKIDIGGHRNNNQSEAELRDVLTLFIKPIITVSLSGNDENDVALCKLLNQLMVIVNDEVVRFKGQLRQFILDDKGLVIITNFGLRGSTFPNMIEERAMPCMKTIKILLKTEMDIECKMGATFGKAYCGVVGASDRHEYAILGPSVNLAARLMAHDDNPGILVDDAVMQKAKLGYPFECLPPVKAKGYSEPVKIFKPSDSTKKAHLSTSVTNHNFVGREDEIEMLVDLADSLSQSDSSKIVLVTGPYGIGKSALMSRVANITQSSFGRRSKSCSVCCLSFCDDDSFRPFSIVRPLFLNLLLGKQIRKDLDVLKNDSQQILCNEQVAEAQLYVEFLQICLESAIPGRWIELLGGLVFTNKLSDIGRWSDRSQKMSEWNVIAMYVVQAFKHCFDGGELVLLVLDNVSGMDEMSWKIISLLYEHARNLLVVGSSRNYFDMNIHPDFWNELKNDGSKSGQFMHMQLKPFNEIEVCQLADKVLDFDCHEDNDLSGNIAKTVYIQSGGNPLLAFQILDKLYADKGWFTTSTDLGNIGELLLNRVDSLSTLTRSYLNLGAILGFSFRLSDIGIIMGRYHGLPEEDIPLYSDTIRKDLQEAVEFGILHHNHDDEVKDEIYSFTHQFWIDNILKYTLDEWKNGMRTIIDEVKEVVTISLPDGRQKLFASNEDDELLSIKLQRLQEALTKIEQMKLSDIEAVINSKESEKRKIKESLSNELRLDMDQNGEKLLVEKAKKQKENMSLVLELKAEASSIRVDTASIKAKIASMKKQNQKLKDLQEAYSGFVAMIQKQSKMLRVRNRKLESLLKKYKQAIKRNKEGIVKRRKFAQYENKIKCLHRQCIGNISRLMKTEYSEGNDLINEITEIQGLLPMKHSLPSGKIISSQKPVTVPVRSSQFQEMILTARAC